MRYYQFVCCFLLCVASVLAKDEEASTITGQNNGKFVPTNEWQTIPEGQGIPPGLHVRIDMQTGKKEAKLLDDTPTSSSSSALISTETETDEDKEEPRKNQDTTWNEAEIKEALKKMKNDANKNEETSNNFRSYEEIKEEMKKLEHSIKTEYEIVKDLVVKYASLQQEEDTEVRLSTLEDLEYYLHQYDNANDFVNMGGLNTVVLPALNASDHRLRSAAAFLLGSACQSNPKTQIAALEAGSIPLLIRLVSFDPSSEVRARALYAISGLVRNFPLAQKSLVENGGLTTFHDIFQTDSADLTKLQLKIVTLLSDLMSERSAVVAQIQMDGNNNITAEKKKQYDAAGVEQVLVEQGFCLLIPRLLTYNESGEHDVVEKVLQAMVSLSTQCNTQFHPVQSLIQTLEDRYQKLSTEDDDYFIKLHTMCRQLLQSQRDEL